MGIVELGITQGELGPSSAEHVSCALHEVSNALTVVLGWLDMASRADSLDDAQQAIQVALEHARRGRVIARRGIGADVESVPTHRFASEVAAFAAQSIEPQAQQKNVRIVVDIEPSCQQRIDGESDALQVLTNLLLNALQFSPENSVISVKVRRASSRITFEVIDEGPGVPEHVALEIFGRGTTTRPDGAGIGLPFSYRLARRNGGDLSLLNANEEGARFLLVWPSAPSLPVAAPKRICSELVGTRILMIEDDASIAQLVELSLEARGAQVLAIVDAERLDEVLGSRPIFDLALLDLSPIKNRTAEILARLSFLAPDAPIILMSGEPGALPVELESRFTDCVRKPFDMDQLVEVVSLRAGRASKVAEA